MPPPEPRAPRRVDWPAAFWAGMAGAALFVLLDLTLPTAGFWNAPHLTAALVLGESALPQAGAGGPSDLLVLIVAMILHVFISIAYAIGLAWILRGWGLPTAFFTGLVYGGAIYVVNFFVLAAVFPSILLARNWGTLLTHMAFGGAVGVVYELVAGRRRAARAGAQVVDGEAEW